MRDITHADRYFTRRGVTVDVEQILDRVGADAHRFRESANARALHAETRGIVSAHARKKTTAKKTAGRRHSRQRGERRGPAEAEGHEPPRARSRPTTPRSASSSRTSARRGAR